MIWGGRQSAHPPCALTPHSAAAATKAPAKGDLVTSDVPGLRTADGNGHHLFGAGPRFTRCPLDPLRAAALLVRPAQEKSPQQMPEDVAIVGDARNAGRTKRKEGALRNWEMEGGPGAGVKLNTASSRLAFFRPFACFRKSGGTKVPRPRLAICTGPCRLGTYLHWSIAQGEQIGLLRVCSGLYLVMRPPVRVKWVASGMCPGADAGLDA